MPACPGRSSWPRRTSRRATAPKPPARCARRRAGRPFPGPGPRPRRRRAPPRRRCLGPGRRRATVPPGSHSRAGMEERRMRQHRMTDTRAWLVSLLLCAVAGPLLAQDSTAVADSAAVDSPAAPADSAIGATPGIAPGQPQVLRGDTTVVVDRVLAVVANRPVLASQVDEEIFSRQAQGAKLPTDPAALDSVRRQVISTIVDEELLGPQAPRHTSIHVPDEELGDGVERQVRKGGGNLGDETAYPNDLRRAGFQAREESRRWLTDQQR